MGWSSKVNKCKNVWAFLKPQMFENSFSDLELDGSLTVRASSFTLNISLQIIIYLTMGASMLFYFFLLLVISSYFSI